MGSVGGGGSIAFATALPPASFVYRIENIKQFMGFLYLIFYASLMLRFLDVYTNPGPRRPVPVVCRILCSNVRGLSEYLVIWPWLRLSMIYDCAVLLWSRYTSRVRVAGSRIWPPCFVVREQDTSCPRDGCIRTRWLRSISPSQIRLWLLQIAIF